MISSEHLRIGITDRQLKKLRKAQNNNPYNMAKHQRITIS